MRLIFVRHGDPNYELDCLTELGHRQAKVTAQRLLDEGIEEIFSSPMGRARQTALPFSELSGIKNIQILDFMKEIRYGHENDLYNQDLSPWVGVDRLADKGVDLQDSNWRRFDLFTDNTATIDIDKVAENADKWLLTLGYKREGLYYKNIRADDSQHTVVLFSHGGSSTAFLSRVLNIPFPLLCASLHIPHTGITILRFDRTPGKVSVPVIELMNDGNHVKKACN
ncbi:MAG: histidine phosphatase family protein [Treponema sp.]|nr:histidine phosphatase family protein [Treponema sp.]